MQPSTQSLCMRAMASLVWAAEWGVQVRCFALKSGSEAGKSVNLGASASYGASKSGLLYLTRHFGLEFAGDNIQVNAVCPGPVETEITKTWTPEHWARVQANLPMGHMAKPLDIANAILFLASPLSDHMTGESILVNGGKFMD